MGVKDYKEKVLWKFRFVVIMVSDIVSRGEKEDKSGKFLVEEFEKVGYERVFYKVVLDEKMEIIGVVVDVFCVGVDVVVIFGGMGILSRDVIIESFRLFFDKEFLFGDIFRFVSYEEIGIVVIMMRVIGGIIRSLGRVMVVFCFLGSFGVVKIGVKFILVEVGYVLKYGCE